MQQMDKLVQMANQIADNFSFHDDTAGRVADHLRRFWAPAMRQKLIEFHDSGGEGLKPAVSRALEILRGA